MQFLVTLAEIAVGELVILSGVGGDILGLSQDVKKRITFIHLLSKYLKNTRHYN